MAGKLPKWPENCPNGHKIYQHLKIHCKTLQNIPKLGFLVRKETIWQPWPTPPSRRTFFSCSGLSRRRQRDGRVTSQLRPLISFDSTERDPDLSPIRSGRGKRRHRKMDDRKNTWSAGYPVFRGTDVMIFQIFSPKNGEKWGF
jgi:hypothetical protein